MSLEELIDRERTELSKRKNLTPVNPETFAKWKKKKVCMRGQARGLGGLTFWGRGTEHCGGCALLYFLLCWFLNLLFCSHMVLACMSFHLLPPAHGMGAVGREEEGAQGGQQEEEEGLYGRQQQQGLRVYE